MSTFPGIGHVALTVRSLAVSRPWYQRLVGAAPVLDEPTDGGFHHCVFLVGETLIGLHEHPGTDPDVPFTELRAGLDHVGFAVADRDALLAWQDRLDELGVAHGGVVDAAYGSGLSFRDPDGLPLEFFAPPASAG